MRLDHLVYAASNVDTDAQALATSLGVEPSPILRYPDLGIETRLVLMGTVPVEVAGVTDARVAEHEPWTRWLQHWCKTEPGFTSWALQVDEIESTATRLGLPVRTAPSGSFSTVGLDESFETRYLPFFIHWTTQHPSTATNDLDVDEIFVQGDARRLHEWAGDTADLPVTLEAGPGRIRGVRVRAAACVVDLT
jgi:hypothetical protein